MDGRGQDGEREDAPRDDAALLGRGEASLVALRRLVEALEARAIGHAGDQRLVANEKECAPAGVLDERHWGMVLGGGVRGGWGANDPHHEAAHLLPMGALLGVDPDRLSLVNGLDEGIMATAVGYLRPSAALPLPEAVIPEPAFEIFRLDTEVVGGTPVRVAPNEDFSFPLQRVLDAITPNTRVVFLTNPNNPTGVLMPKEAIRRVAQRVPKGGVVFDEQHLHA